MNRVLFRPGSGYDRRAIMGEGHYQYRVMGRAGWTFGRCLSYAWKKAGAQRERALSVVRASDHAAPIFLNSPPLEPRPIAANSDATDAFLFRYLQAFSPERATPFKGH